MAFGDPKGGTKARFEIATRIAIGLCVALIFGIAWWWRSPIKYDFTRLFLVLFAHRAYNQKLIFEIQMF